MRCRLPKLSEKTRCPFFLYTLPFPKRPPSNQLLTIQCPREENFQKIGQIVPELGPEPSDIVITKKQWGAFYGTDLDLRLRRGGLDTIVLAGIATSYGVESTARFAYEYGYQQIFAEDAMSDRSREAHDSSIEFVLKRIGRVRKTADILNELKSS